VSTIGLIDWPFWYGRCEDRVWFGDTWDVLAHDWTKLQVLGCGTSVVYWFWVK
jgi:hypothetical protein